MKHSKLCKATAALILTAVLTLSPNAAVFAAPDDTLPSLKDIYEDYFLVGNIFTPMALTSETAEFMQKHYNTVTAENAMKPSEMQSGRGEFNFSSVDKAVTFFNERDMAVHGHTLVWHNQSPKWLNTGVTREEAAQNMADHINGVAGHYAGQLLSWDVVNEAMDDGNANPEDWRSCLRRSDWFQSYAQDGADGSDYLYDAFKLAREADPDAILYYNDYNLNISGKAKAVYCMVKELNERYLAEGNDRLLIEGVGMQGHYDITTTPDSVRGSLDLFRELGVEVSITELDVRVNGAAEGGLTAEQEERQALVYAQLFVVFKENADIIERVTFWGLNDRFSWRAKYFPQIFDAAQDPKAAFFAVADPEGFLAERGLTQPAQHEMQKGSAAYGTPDIDGEIDAVWAEAESLPVKLMLQAWDTASGNARVLWDENNLYVLVEVRDSLLDDSAMQVHEQDSVEVFFDQKNDKTSSYGSDDGQYRVSYNGRESFGDSTGSQGFRSATSHDGTSYNVEMSIPFTAITPAQGLTIGFDVQINDGAYGARAGVAKWNDTSPSSYVDTKGWGELTLSGEATGAPQGGNDTPESTPASETDAGGDNTAADQSSPSPKPSGNEDKGVGVNKTGLIMVCVGGGILALIAIVYFVVKRLGK